MHIGKNSIDNIGYKFSGYHIHFQGIGYLCMDSCMSIYSLYVVSIACSTKK